MSWAAEEWKDGLPQKVLAKINQIESQLERFKKERDQKQFQLQSLEQALEVQKRKGGNEKSEIAALKRENQSLTEACQLLEVNKDKLANDLLLKEKLVGSLEQKVAELNSQQGTVKNNGSTGCQQEEGAQLQSNIITSLELEIAELRKQLKEGDETSQSVKRGVGDESSCTKTLRHPSEGDELRKTQLELQTLRSLVSEMETKNKKLLQEGECARHNAEAARQHLEARMKESEKELKRELAQALEASKNAERVLQESKSKLQQEVNAAQAEHVRFQGFVDKLEADKASMLREHDDVAKKIASADGVVKSSLAAVADAEKKIAAAESEKQKLASELSQKDQEIQARCAEVMKLKADLGLKDQATDSLKGQLMDRSLELETAQAEAEKVSQKFLQTENQLMDLQKQRLKADQHLKEISTSCNQLQSEKEKLETSNADLMKQLEKVQGEVGILSASLKTTQVQMAEADTNFKEAQHKWKDLENKLRCELDQSLASLAQTTDLKTQMENQLSAKDRELQELLNQSRMNQELISGKDSEISQKDWSITELEKQLQALQSQHDSFQKENHQQNMAASEKIANAEEAFKNKSEELGVVEAKYSQEKVLYEAEIEQLMSQKGIFETELNSSKAECEKSKNLIASLNGDVEALKAELDAKATSWAEVDSVIQNQQRELEEKMKETVTLNNEISQRDHQVCAMKDTITEAEKQLEKSNMELQLVGGKCEALECERESFISEIDEFKRQVACGVQREEVHLKEMTELQRLLEVSQSQCLSLSKQAYLDQQKMVDLEKESYNLHVTCSELESRICGYKSELEDKSEATSKLEEKCRELSERYDEELARNSCTGDRLSRLEAQLWESNKLHQQVVGEVSDKLVSAVKCSEGLQRSLELKEDKVTELGNEIIELKNGALELKTLHGSLKDEIECKSALVAGLEERCAFLSDQLAETEQRLSENELLLSTDSENLAQLQRQLKQLEEEKAAGEFSSSKHLDLLQQQVSQQGESLSQKDFRILELEGHTTEINTKLTEALKEATEADKEHTLKNEMLKSKLELLQMDLDENCELVQEFNGKISNLTTMLENMTQERNSLQTNSQSLRVELDELRCVSETDKLSLEQLQQEMCDLREKSNNLETTAGNIRAELEEKNAVLAEKDSCLENAQTVALRYEAQLTEHKVENDKLVSQINCLEQAVSTAVESDASKTQEIERLSVNCSLLSDQLEAITTQLSEQKMEVSMKTQYVQDIELKLKQLEKDSSEYQERMQKELEDLNRLVDEKDETLVHVGVGREELESRKEDLSRELAEHEHEVAVLKSQVGMLEMDVEDKDVVIQEMNTKVSNFQTQIEALAQEKVQMSQTETGIESELLALRRSLEEEREKVAQAKRSEEATNERIHNLKTSLSESRHQVEEQKRAIEYMQTHYDKLDHINANNEHLSTKFKADKEELVSMIVRLQASLDLEIETAQSRSSELEAVNRRCAEMVANLGDLRVELSQLQEELATKTESLDQMEEKVKHQESEIAGLRDESSQDLELLQQNLNERDALLKDSRSKVEYLENHCSDLEVKLKDALSVKSEESAQLEHKIAVLKSQVGMLEMDVEDKDVVIQEMNTKVSNFQTQIEALAQEKVQMSQTETGIESELLALRRSLEEEREKVAQAKRSEEATNERIHNLKTSLSESRHQVEEQKRAIEYMQTHYDKLDHINANNEHLSTKFKADKEELVSMIVRLQASLDLEIETAQSRSSELEAVNRRCAEMVANLGDLRVELSQLQEELATKTESLDQMEEKVKHQESEIAGLRDESSQDLELLQQNLNERDALLKDSRSKVEYLENHCSDLEVKLKDALSVKSEESAQLEHKIAVLKSQVGMLEMDVEDKDVVIQEMNTKVSNFQTQIEALAQEKVQMSQTETGIESELLALRRSLEEEREKVAQAKRSEEATNERIHNLKTSLSESRHQVEEQKRAIEYMQTHYDKLDHINSNNEHLSTKFKADKEELVSMIVRLQASLDLEIETAQSRSSELEAVNRRCAEMVANLGDLRVELYQLQEELATKTESLDQMEEKVKHQESEIAGLRNVPRQDLKQQNLNTNQIDDESTLKPESQNSQPEESQQSLGDEHVTDAPTTVPDLEKKLAQVTALLESKEQHIVQLDCELKEVLVCSEGLRLSISQNVDQIYSLEATVMDLNQKLEQISAEKLDSENGFSQEKENIHLQMSTMQEKLESKSNDLETQNDDLNKSMSQLSLRLAELQAEKTAVHEQLDEVRKLLGEAKCDLLKKDDINSILREELEDLLNENDALKTDKGDWQTKEEKYRQEINDLEVKLTDVNTEIESTRDSFESLSDQRFEAQSKLQNVTLEKKDLETKLVGIKAELIEKKKENGDLQCAKVELDSLKNKVIYKDNEMVHLRAQLEKSELDSDVLRKQKKEVERDFKEVSKRNKELEERLCEFTAVTKEMKDQLSQLQGLIQTLNSSLDSKKQEIVQRVNEISKLDDEISKMKADRKELNKANMEMSKELANIQKENSSTVGTLQDAIESLNYELNDAEKEKASLISDNELLKSENLELMDKIKTLMNEILHFEEVTKELRAATSAKGSLGTPVDMPEKRTPEKRSRDYDSVVLEKDQLWERVQTLQSVEIDKQKLEIMLEQELSGKSVLSERVLELEGILVGKVNVEKELQDMKMEKAELLERIKLLQSDDDQLDNYMEEMDQNITDLTAKRDLLQETVAKLESNNSRLEESVKEMTNKIKDWALEKDSLEEMIRNLESGNDQHKEKIQELGQNISESDEMVKDLTLQKDSLEEMVKSLESGNSQHEEKSRELNQTIVELNQMIKELDQNVKELTSKNSLVQEMVKNLESYNSLLEEKIQELDQNLKDLTTEKSSAQEMVKDLESDNSQLEEKIQELDQNVKDLTIEKSSAQEMVKDLESYNSLLEEKIQELDQTVKDLTSKISSAQEMVNDLESDNSQLEEKIQELEQNVKDLTTEKSSIQEMVKDLESYNSELEEKIKVIRAELSEYNVSSENNEEHKKTLANTTNELHLVTAEKNQLKAKLKELQGSHSLALGSQNGDKHGADKHKELLLKWQTTCSQLTTQNQMDRKKIQQLMEQVERLKLSKDTDNVEDITTLRDELEEIKQERQDLKEKYLKMSQAGERHCTRAKDLQRMNEKLNSRNKLLNALLKGTKPHDVLRVASVSSITSTSIEIVHETTSKSNVEMSEAIPLKTSKSNVEMTEAVPKTSTDSPCKGKLPMRVTFGMASDITSLNTDTETPGSASKKGIATTQVTPSSSVASSNASHVATDTNLVISNPRSPRSKHHSPKHSAQKSKITTPKSSTSRHEQSNSKIAAQVATLVATVAAHMATSSSHSEKSTEKLKREIPSKIRTPGSKSKVSKLAETHVPKSAASPPKPTSTRRTSPTRSNGPIKLHPNVQTVGAPEQPKAIPSPRASRQLSMQKRRSVDQSNEMAGGKKSKLSVKATITETSNDSGSKSSVQQRRLPQPVQSKQSHAPSLLKPMRTRSKKEDGLVDSSLVTITNSPRKVRETRGSRRSKTQANKEPEQQFSDEGASDCKIN